MNYAAAVPRPRSPLWENVDAFDDISNNDGVDGGGGGGDDDDDSGDYGGDVTVKKKLFKLTVGLTKEKKKYLCTV